MYLRRQVCSNLLSKYGGGNGTCTHVLALRHPGNYKLTLDAGWGYPPPCCQGQGFKMP